LEAHPPLPPGIQAAFLGGVGVGAVAVVAGAGPERGYGAGLGGGQHLGLHLAGVVEVEGFGDLQQRAGFDHIDAALLQGGEGVREPFRQLGGHQQLGAGVAAADVQFHREIVWN
jgi:hypothetical protein